jgi:anaerobic selenocysteine-containing dehydrogenase
LTLSATGPNIASHTLGFDRLEREVLPRFTPEHVSAITGIPIADIERIWPTLYGNAKAPFLRLARACRP